MGALFQSLQPSHNPLGFGAVDFVELFLALVLAALTRLWQGRIQAWTKTFAEHTSFCMVLLFLLPIALRLLLLPHYPAPQPVVADDFSYVLLADTLRHFRLSNPALPLPQFFESLFVLQEPTYSSIFPMGQGIALAIGWTLFGSPWAGVLLSIGLMCALVYWALRAWTTQGWALLGGMLAVAEFGPLNQWTNSFWGGAVSAIAGCLVFGCLPQARHKYAAIAGLGLGLQLLTRPFEFILLTAVTLAALWGRWRSLVAIAICLAPALLLTGLQNRAVTGSWITLPYSLSQQQYGVPASFSMQPMPVPHRQLTREQQLDYQLQRQVHDSYYEAYSRVRYLRFFYYPALFVALGFFLPRIRERKPFFVAAAILLFAFGTSFYPYFYTHYVAALTPLFLVAALYGLQRLSMLRNGAFAARLVIFLCAAHFLFWYGLHFFGGQAWAEGAMTYESWDAINSGDPGGHRAVRERLRMGKHLVFVRYGPAHTFDEWVYNDANIEQAPIVWARDLGEEQDRQLVARFPGRSVWLLEPDARPTLLTPFP